MEYTVNQQGFIFGETIDKGALDRDSLSERRLIDNGGTFGEMINNESLSERQSISKGDTFGETIDKEALLDRRLTWRNYWRDNQSTRGALLERRLTRGHFWRDNQLTRGKFLERLNNTSTVLLMVSLLLVNHCRPSHIQYALYLFLSCLRDGGIFQDRIILFDTVKMLQLISTGMFLYYSYCSGSCYPSNLTVYNILCTYFVHAS